MSIVDGYSLRARFYPAVLGVAPAFALAAITAAWQAFNPPQAILTLAVGVLFFAFSDLARRMGKHAERKLFSSTGGRPFPTVLRYRDSTLDHLSKVRYLDFLGDILKEGVPSEELEKSDPTLADQFYMRAGNWLRERTRSKEAYPLVYEENVTYGFRRNLFGIKWFALALNVMVVLGSLALLRYFGTQLLNQVGSIITVAVLHALYFLFVVTKKSVIEASDQYGRQLVLACETLSFEQSKKEA